ncbi:hypothetical protein M2437_002506 [Methylorubrum pseudosasae]|nr:hypothetical protein [Methylorubrum pseudosasae]
MPPLASSNRPMRRATAPVKAPFSWPNSSDSSRASGIAAQLTETNGRPARFDVGVDVAGQHLLAGAALAGDEHGGFRAGDLLGEPHHALHGRIAPDETAGVRRHGL